MVRPGYHRSHLDLLDLAVTLGGPTRAVACGSIYLIGHVRQSLTRCFGTPVPARDIRTG